MSAKIKQRIAAVRELGLDKETEAMVIARMLAPKDEKSGTSSAASAQTRSTRPHRAKGAAAASESDPFLARPCSP